LDTRQLAVGNNLIWSRVTLKSFRSLFAKGVTSKAEVEALENEVRSLENELRALEASSQRDRASVADIEVRI
jgi:hypothetical protein